MQKEELTKSWAGNRAHAQLVDVSSPDLHMLDVKERGSESSSHKAKWKMHRNPLIHSSEHGTSKLVSSKNPLD